MDVIDSEYLLSRSLLARPACARNAMLAHSHIHARTLAPSVHLHPLLLEFCSRLLDLLHEVPMRFRDVVEGEYAVTEFREEVCAERDDAPERKLECMSERSTKTGGRAGHTTGITSLWSFSGNGARPRNATM